MIKRWGELKKFDVTCFICNKKFSIKEKEKDFPRKLKYYCSKSCANTRFSSDETNKKRSKTLKKYYPPFNRNCPKCNNIIPYNSRSHLLKSEKRKSTCKKCLIKKRKLHEFYKRIGRIGGKISSKNQIKRSKNEILFSNLCKTKFKNVITNKPMFNGWDADIVLPDEKIAILWNGKWHYEKITKNHSVLQVQNRDKIKLDEITKLGYIYYVIKDMGKYNPLFVNEEFDNFLKFVNKQI